MSSEVIVAIITGLCSVMAVALTNAKASRDMDAKLDKQQAVIEEKISSLQNRVEQHNKVIDRTYVLEQEVALQGAEIKRNRERVKALEEKVV